MSEHRPAVWSGGKKSLKAYADGGGKPSNVPATDDTDDEGGTLEATDAAAELADELNVDLATVTTRTGKGGKITVWDVREAAGKTSGT